MIGDSFWELFWFPLIVLVVGIVDLILGAWIPLLILSLVFLAIYSAIKARKKT